MMHGIDPHLLALGVLLVLVGVMVGGGITAYRMSRVLEKAGTRCGPGRCSPVVVRLYNVPRYYLVQRITEAEFFNLTRGNIPS